MYNKNREYKNREYMLNTDPADSAESKARSGTDSAGSTEYTTMVANYHTHTWRCNHAYGVEKQYIENAIEAGLRILGFSDHTPYCFPNGYVGPDKMLPSQLEDYVDTVLRLRDEYRDDIEIRLGLEAEYYPEIWEGLLELIEPYPIEYLLLGQHYIHNEYEGDRYNGRPGHGEKDLLLYCSQCLEALETGRFLYFAHPDLSGPLCFQVPLLFHMDDRLVGKPEVITERVHRHAGIPGGDCGGVGK